MLYLVKFAAFLILDTNNQADFNCLIIGNANKTF